MRGTRPGIVGPDGTGYTRAVAGPFEVTRLVFPASFRHGSVEPERGYLVGRTRRLGREVVRLPHDDAFALEHRDLACRAPRIRVRSRAARRRFSRSGRLTGRLRDSSERSSAGHRHLTAAVSTTLGWRMACELESRDAGWSLALEGLVLQLLAATGRVAEPPPAHATRLASRSPRPDARARTRSIRRSPELAAAVGRHPTHVARAFRREHGVTVAEYSRSLRLDWARTQLVVDDVPLSRIAIDAGFADQSHFTRAFRRHHGITPGRYRELARR